MKTLAKKIGYDYKALEALHQYLTLEENEDEESLDLDFFLEKYVSTMRSISKNSKMIIKSLRDRVKKNKEQDKTYQTMYI